MRMLDGKLCKVAPPAVCTCGACLELPLVINCELVEGAVRVYYLYRSLEKLIAGGTGGTQGAVQGPEPEQAAQPRQTGMSLGFDDGDSVWLPHLAGDKTIPLTQHTVPSSSRLTLYVSQVICLT